MKHINKYFLQFFSVYKNDKIIIKTQRIRLKKVSETYQNLSKEGNDKSQKKPEKHTKI